MVRYLAAVGGVGNVWSAVPIANRIFVVCGLVCAKLFVDKGEDVVKGKDIPPLPGATLGVRV